MAPFFVLYLIFSALVTPASSLGLARHAAQRLAAARRGVDPVHETAAAAALNGAAFGSEGALSGEGVTAGRSAGGGGGGGGGETTHHSVFKMKIGELDSELFWKLLMGMLLATALADRCVYFVNRAVAGNKTLERFVAKVYAELMMFGCVAIGLFVYTNLAGSMTDETHLLFEFSDILCSFGACGLILLAVTMFCICRGSSYRWASLETGEYHDPVLAGNYARLKKTFCKRQGLKESFQFCTYLDEVVAENCIAVISIERRTWLTLMIIPVLGGLARYFSGRSMSDMNFMWELLLLNWLTFLMFMALVTWIQVILKNLWKKLIHSEKSMATRMIDNVGSETLGHFAWALQLVALNNSFLVSMFFMTEVYNAETLSSVMGFFWINLQAAPLFVNTVILFPVLIHRLSIVQGFYAPNADVVGYVLELEHKLDEDLLFLQRSYADLGQPDLTELCDTSELSKVDFAKMLLSMKLFISEERRTRLFDCMDLDHGGTISVDEVQKVLVPGAKSPAATTPRLQENDAEVESEAS
eukprot:TRINITY_DN6302_c0_g1_i1.p1 TRINITY_DN6302_c0_g1~~TRINITY_DN6302_c0_g1_i1.p1  ORF type:complete len:539 (+),score=132.99 TRINITY_DN6302_c0_g1_i1:35-1618(+)